VLALVSGALTSDAAAALAAERSWELRNVSLVSEAVAGMQAGERDLVQALIVEAEPVGASLLAQLPSLELIGCLRSDPVNVDVSAATVRGIAVIHTPGRNAEAVADFALGLCLAALRNIAIAHHDIVSGELTTEQPSRGLLVAPGDAIWRPDDPDAPVPYLVYRGRELSGLVVGVIGFGWTGQAVARRFAGLVRAVHVADPAVSADVIRANGYIPATLAELIAVADVVTIHARGATTIVGRDELKQMKHGAILINTARATVLDYEALLDALNSGQLRAAALDVFPEEPIRTSSPLLTQPSLTLTPHLAGAAADVVERQSEILLAAVRGLYDGAGASGWDGLHVRNPEVRREWRAARMPSAGTPVGEAGAAG
jgi:D-3-phosphoglycerate dehydrogenase / 2-oxoglutarate reductase